MRFQKNTEKPQGHFLSIAFSPEHTPPDEDKEIKPPEKSAVRVNASAQASKSNIEELSGEETPIVGSMSEAQAAKRLISPEEQVRKRGSSSNHCTPFLMKIWHIYRPPCRPLKSQNQDMSLKQESNKLFFGHFKKVFTESLNVATSKADTVAIRYT